MINALVVRTVIEDVEVLRFVDDGVLVLGYGGHRGEQLAGAGRHAQSSLTEPEPVDVGARVRALVGLGIEQNGVVRTELPVTGDMHGNLVVTAKHADTVADDALRRDPRYHEFVAPQRVQTRFGGRDLHVGLHDSTGPARSKIRRVSIHRREEISRCATGRRAQQCEQ